MFSMLLLCYNCACIRVPYFCLIFHIIVKLLDWGEDGMATAETAALRASFRQEVAVWHKLDHPNVTKVPALLLTSLYCFYGLRHVISIIVTICIR